MKDMKYQRNGADPCLCFKWTAASLIIWLPWIDDYMVWDSKKEVPKTSEQFNNRFDCNYVGEVKEYVGCKINLDEEGRSTTFTQPVPLQSFEDEFELTEIKAKTPAEVGKILIKADPENKVVQA
eukprot:10199802-Ditylum_brightwellii.AAC.1